MEWISVAEKPSDDYGVSPILLTDGKAVTIGYWNENGGRWPWVVFDPGTEDDLNGWPDSNVTHWQPLPDPPEEKS